MPPEPAAAVTARLRASASPWPQRRRRRRGPAEPARWVAATALAVGLRRRARGGRAGGRSLGGASQTSQGLLGRCGRWPRSCSARSELCRPLFLCSHPAPSRPLHFSDRGVRDYVRTMSGNNLSGNDEFDEQLRMQELYGGDPKEGDTQNEPSGEADSLGQLPDDTPYEWDLDKKAWFPKVRKSSGVPLRSGAIGLPGNPCGTSLFCLLR